MKLLARARLLGKRLRLQGCNMDIEVLISTMNESSIDCYKRFNLETNALIINQTDHNSYEEIDTGDFKVRMISTDTRGLGVSRNLAILNSKADVLVFADDDEVFEEGYAKTILDEFKAHPNVDFFIFKTIIYQDGKEIVKVRKEEDLALYKSLRYGSVHFVFKKEPIVRNNISVSTYFGAGTGNGSGEDSLFLRDAFKAGLKLRTSTKLIAKIYNDDSTWFEGYNEKFFYDKGMLAKALFPKTYRLYIKQFLLRHKDMTKDIKYKPAKKLMLAGADDFGGKNGK